jgi:hypothetical protein
MLGMTTMSMLISPLLWKLISKFKKEEIIEFTEVVDFTNLQEEVLLPFDKKQ